MLQVQRALIFLLLILFISTAWIYTKFDSTLHYTSANVTNMELNNLKRIVKAIAGNITLNIKQGSMYEQLKYNKKLREKLDKILSLYVNDEMKYVYVIYKDKKGRYRYLLDGSKIAKERGAFNQIFIPVSNIWDVCFKTKKDIFTVQKNIASLWITYLHPIIINKKMQAVLALDISTITDKKIEKSLIPLRMYLKYLIMFMFIVIFTTAFQIYLLFRERKVSRIDALTRLYNRHYLQEKKNTISLRRVAVAMVDIDHFKDVNDTFGHDVGDIVLRNIAKRLIIYTRAEDVVIRYGGEEFLIIFELEFGKKDIDNIINVAKRIQKQVSENPIRAGDINVSVTVSLGLDPYTYRRHSLEESISIADLMLYAAKRNGRNRVEIAKG